MSDQESRLAVMDRATRQAGLRAAEYGFYGAVVGVLASIATFRYRKVPYFVSFGVATGCGKAFIDGNNELRKSLQTRETPKNI